MRITHFSASFPARWERLHIDHPVSLGAALLVIALSSLAFWWNQPDGLFDGGEPACPSAYGKPGGQDAPLFTRGLLSLEVFSAMTRAMPRTSSSLPAADHGLDAPNASTSCVPNTRIGR
ncbi:hypothetical protein [Paraburkholderia dipogonis]|uniref:hypothetical protein n=1 Tax=Paraburkholderia dipogonis TaxID=1211383 RepID=UPI0038B9F0C2